jgi:two-component system, chemotaxis family, chemotaxis protein CheY
MIILLVEDNPDTSQVLTLLLGVEGITVITAGDGLEGLKKADASRPDLIITDLYMPRLSGIEMIEGLRQNEKFSKVPIIALTGHAEEEASNAIKAGADGVFNKSDKFEKLISMIKSLTQFSEQTG